MIGDSKNNKNKVIFRKILIINKSFQYRFLLFMFTVLFVTAVSFYAAIYLFFWKFQKIGNSIGLSSDHVFFKFISEQQDSMNMVFLITILIITILFGLLGIIFSNWIAGPLYRLNRHMTDIAQGKDLRPVKFRNNDFFPELSDSFNQMISRLRDPLSKKDK